MRGDLRTYKIHLGSGNILMEPNDQYLCIVPGRGSTVIEEVFLPFEGDTVFSIILSKAFLLAEDRKITDPSITKQINPSRDMTLIRPAREADLRALYEVWYQTEVVDNPNPPSPGEVPAYLSHVLRTRTIFVAEQDGEVLAFAGTIRRGNIAFLTDLFVRPACQSGQLGKTLLQAVFPQTAKLVHCTISSSDPRALALYIRAGMQPQWPFFALHGEKPSLRLPDQGIEFIEADPADPELIEWDAQIGGRRRSEDHIFWIHEQEGLPYWFRRVRAFFDPAMQVGYDSGSKRYPALAVG